MIIVEVRHFGYFPKLRTLLHQFDPYIAREDIIYLVAVKALTGTEVTAAFWIAVQHSMVGGYQRVAFIFTIEDTIPPYLSVA
jgi:hypothetical protein